MAVQTAAPATCRASACSWHVKDSSCTGWCGLSTCVYGGLRCPSSGLFVQAGSTRDCPLCCVTMPEIQPVEKPAVLMCRLARLEHLIERRPELLSSVMLRQNPHAVHEWHKRVKLFTGNPTKQILTYTEAVKTVDPDKVGMHLLLHEITSRYVGAISSRCPGVVVHSQQAVAVGHSEKVSAHMNMGALQ